MIGIRRATAHDAAGLAKFAREVFVATFAADNRPEDMATYLASAYGEDVQLAEIVDPQLITIVADDRDGIAAYAQMKPEPDALLIKRFYVQPELHGRGVAISLMSEVESIARSLNLNRLRLGVWERNFRAIAFYAKCGFTDSCSQEFLLGADLQTDRIIEKDLAK